MLSRDPFVWPNSVHEPTNSAQGGYHIVGITFNNVTHHYTALLRCNDNLFFVNQHDVLPNQLIVKKILHDQIELMDTANQMTINWFP